MEEAVEDEEPLEVAEVEVSERNIDSSPFSVFQCYCLDVFQLALKIFTTTSASINSSPGFIMLPLHCFYPCCFDFRNERWC